MSDPQGTVYKGGSAQGTSVDQVDISWPEGKDASIKTSNPLLQGDPSNNDQDTTI